MSGSRIRAGWVSGRAFLRACIRPTAASARRCRASPFRSGSHSRLRFPAVRPLGVIGHLSRDIVAGGPPRLGGAPWYAGRALRLLGDDAVLFAKCGEDDRARWQRTLAAIGLPASLSTGGETTSFSFRYAADGL